MFTRLFKSHTCLHYFLRTVQLAGMNRWLQCIWKQCVLALYWVLPPFSDTHLTSELNSGQFWMKTQEKHRFLILMCCCWWWCALGVWQKLQPLPPSLPRLEGLFHPLSPSYFSHLTSLILLLPLYETVTEFQMNLRSWRTEIDVLNAKLCIKAWR